MSIQIGTNTIQHNNNVKIIGFTLDTNRTLEKQISNTCRTSYIMQIRRIRSIRRYLYVQSTELVSLYIGYWTLNNYYYYYYYYLTVDAARTLVQATVTARLDYCNSIDTNLPMKTVHRLQITQNSAARLVSRTPRHENTTPVLVQLHWLPITKRYQFKILTMT